MSAMAMLLSAASSVALLASGYLYGARRGRDARRAIERELSRPTPPIEGAKATDVDALRHEVRAVMRTLGDQERNQTALHAELRQGLAGLAKQATDPERLQQDMQKLMAPLLRKQDDTTALRDMMKDLLKPIVDRDRLGRELSSLQDGLGLGELPRMLDAIAEKGGFSTVVLSDDMGLPLAANTTAINVDTLAGVASWLLTLVERAERTDAPTPLAVVVQDSSNQFVLHRIFEVGAQRFTLTAVSRGLNVAPGALDGALGKLEKVLHAPRN